MDGRILQDDVILARVLLKQTGEIVYRQYRALLEAQSEHALSLVAGIMYLQRYELLGSHINELLQVPEQAFQAALGIVASVRSRQQNETLQKSHKLHLSDVATESQIARMRKFNKDTVHTYINTAIKKHPFLAEYREKINENIVYARVLVRGLVLLHDYNLSKMIPYLLDNPKDSYQLANGFITLCRENHLNETVNMNTLLKCSAAASSAATLIIMLKRLDLSDYVEHMGSHPEYIESLLYVCDNFADKKHLATTFKNALSKIETLKFIDYAYKIICENDKLHFMALASPSDKARVVVMAVEKRFQRKSLKTNYSSFHYKSLLANTDMVSQGCTLKK